MSEGRSPERLYGAAACGRDLMAKPFTCADYLRGSRPVIPR